VVGTRRELRVRSSSLYERRRRPESACRFSESRYSRIALRTSSSASRDDRRASPERTCAMMVSSRSTDDHREAERLLHDEGRISRMELYRLDFVRKFGRLLRQQLEDIVFHSEHCDLLCPLLPLREGHVPQGPAAEHPAVEQGPGGDSEASARGGMGSRIVDSLRTRRTPSNSRVRGSVCRSNQ
jgi:hypothetical protein